MQCKNTSVVIRPGSVVHDMNLIKMITKLMFEANFETFQNLSSQPLTSFNPIVTMKKAEEDSEVKSNG